MAIGITINRIGVTDTDVVVEGLLVPSGTYPTGGDTVDFTGTNSVITYVTEAAQQANQIPSNLGPLGAVEIFEQPASGASPAGYQMWLIAGSTMANWLLFFATAVAQPPTQLGAGAYPAGLAAATIQFRAHFNFGV